MIRKREDDTAVRRKVRQNETKADLDIYQSGACARGYDDGELHEIMALRKERGWV